MTLGRPNVWLLIAGLALLLGGAAGVQPLAAQTYCAPPAPVPPAPPQDDPHPHCETCPNYCQGSPCYLATGTYVTDATDLSIRMVGPGLHVGRKYESHRNVDGPLGVGWTSTLTPRLYEAVYLKSAPSTYLYEVHVRLPDGFDLKFNKQGTGSYTSADGRQDTLTKAQDGSWTLGLQNSTTTLQFNVDGSLNRLNGEYGTGLQYQYDTSGRVIRIDDLLPSNRYVTVQWGTDGRIDSVTDHTNRVVRYHYDSASGTLTSVDDALTSTLTNQDAVHYTYTAGRFGPVLSKIEDRWYRTVSELEWYPSGQLESYTEGEFDSANPASSPGQKYTYTYYPNGLPGANPPLPATQKRDARNYLQTFYYGPTGLKRDNMTFDDATGRVLSKTDDFGRSTFTYDGSGRLATLTRQGIYTGYVKWTYAYDTAYPGNIASITADNPHSWSGQRFTYYAATALAPGAPKEVVRVYTDMLGVETTVVTDSFEYNAHGQTTKHTARGRVTTFTYDASGDVRSVTEAGATTQFEYDALGRVTKTTDPAGRSKVMTYDALDRVVSVTLPKPAITSVLNFTTTIEYDDWDAATGLVFADVQDINGRVTRQGYDVLAHVIKSVDAAGNETNYSYINSLLAGITDANQNVTRYAYDAVGNAQSTTFPDGEIESYIYSSAGTLLKRTDRRGIQTSYSYDFVGRLVSRDYSTGGVSLVYDGELLKKVIDGMRSPSVSTDFTYDATFRLASEEAESGYLITYDYKPYTDVVERYTITPPSGSSDTAYSVSYAYDASQRVSSIGWSRVSGYFRFTYEPDGAYSTIEFPNGQERRYTYDGQGRLARIYATRPNVSTPAISFTYDYDANWSSLTPGSMLGQLTSVDVVSDFASVAEGKTKYSYDANYQLISAATPTNTSTWTYDAIGNRLTADGLAYNYYKNAGNTRNSSRLRSTPTKTYTYDKNGNRAGMGGIVFGWDDENRLATYGTATAPYATFTYDYRNRRVASSLDSTKYIVRDLDVIGERSAVAKNDYLFAPDIDQPLARVDATGAVNYFMVDGLGSVVGVTDGSGTAVASASYTPWGDTASRIPSLFGYTARESAGIEGLYFYRARYYDPEVGRFISEDPIQDYIPVVGSPVYSYAANSPVAFDDPFGLACRDTILRGPKQVLYNIRTSTGWRPGATGSAGNDRGGRGPAPIAPMHSQPAREAGPGLPIVVETCWWTKIITVTQFWRQRVRIITHCDCCGSWGPGECTPATYTSDDVEEGSDVISRRRRTVGTQGWMVLGLMHPCRRPSDTEE